MKCEISVKHLAEFVHQRGDLYPPLEGRATAEEGIETQRRVQRRREPGYERERILSAVIQANDIELSISGRVDGFLPQRFEVEEIKTTRADPEQAEHYLGSAQWAQLLLYAALLARDLKGEQWSVLLTYVNPDDLAERVFRREVGRAELEEYLQQTVAVYTLWQSQQLQYRIRRDIWLKARDFPFGSFRLHQKAMARRVFRAFRDAENLLLEAPTGSGKTLGVLYPATKALAESHVARVFFLTSRSTGAIAARDACESLAPAREPLRYVELIAKEKACAVPGTRCRSDQCEYAQGYYDRRQEAVVALLEHRAMTAGTVREVAEQFRVCPFELSLDVALWSDIIIGDYNYLLDPVVRLQRFADDDTMGVLVDEAHQLGERVRDMLSLSLSRQAVKRALAEAPPAPLKKSIDALDRALLALRRQAQIAAECQIDEPQALLAAVPRVLEVLADRNIELEAWPACQQLIFDLSRWQRSEAWRDQDNFRFFAAAGRIRSGRRAIIDVTVKLACLDPGPYLAKLFASYGPHVRFSGTVSPLEIYQRLHGLPDAPAERVQSLFSAQQMGLFIVPDISVLYRHRSGSLRRLADLVARTCAAQPGNYLVALSSFEYLEMLSAELTLRHADLDLVCQSRGMSVAARDEFLTGFNSGAQRLGLVVLGGVFAESVDFSAAQLNGVICVGLGLPPAEPVRNAIADRFAGDSVTDGQTVAYQQPAMSKVLQMAGRLLRGPEDRGVICLVDGRFRDPEYQRFFPAHWHPAVVSSRAMGPQLENFWQAEPGLPRLAADTSTA